MKRHIIRLAVFVLLGIVLVGTITTLHTSKTYAASSSPNATSVNSMIDQVFGSYAPQAERIAQCESGFNPNAFNAQLVGGSNAEGVFQILYPSTWMTTSPGRAGLSPYDAQANIQAAYEIFARDGYSWREWECQP